jgi:4-phosphopantoate--beta-alanine ligase
MRIQRSHPRYTSLIEREKICQGLAKGIAAEAGLIAHGRGEAFDYLIGERTLPIARKAAVSAVALFLSAENPVVSINGNVASLLPGEIVKLADLLGAKIEVNLFYYSRERARRIKEELIRHGASSVLLPGKARIPGLPSPRGRVNPSGIYSADSVFVPLEDGDRTEALVRMGKKVVVVDLNPLSRSARAATIAIVDNLRRCIPSMIDSARKMKKWSRNRLRRKAEWDNEKALREVLDHICESISRKNL